MRKDIKREELTPGTILEGKVNGYLFVLTAVTPGGSHIGQSFFTRYTVVGFNANDNGALGSGLPYHSTLAEVRRYWKRSTHSLNDEQATAFKELLADYLRGIMITPAFQRAMNALLGLPHIQYPF